MARAIPARGSSTRRIGGRVRALFADEHQLEGDVLVGADGLHSRVRSLVNPGAPQPRYTGVLSAWGYVPDHPAPEPPGIIRMFFGRRRFFMYTQAEARRLSSIGYRVRRVTNLMTEFI
jgi:FAD-dependent urate hydroxylase